MANQEKKEKGAPTSAGKSAGKIANYYGSGRLLEKKLRHVIQSSGYKAGIDWAEKHGAVDILRNRENAENGPVPSWLKEARDRFLSPRPPEERVPKLKEHPSSAAKPLEQSETPVETLMRHIGVEPEKASPGTAV